MLDFTKCRRTTKDTLIAVSGGVSAQLIRESLETSGFHDIKTIPVFCIVPEICKDMNLTKIDLNNMAKDIAGEECGCTDIIMTNINLEDAMPILKTISKDPDYLKKREEYFQELDRISDEATDAYWHPEKYRGDAFTVFEEEAETRKKTKNRRRPGEG